MSVGEGILVSSGGRDAALPLELVRQFLSLWAVFALLGLLTVVMAALLAASRHRRRARMGAKGRGPVIRDAWQEAGRRMPTPPADPEPGIDEERA